jgi:hypothetical protein
MSLISAHVALSVNWATELTLNSDQLPIGITIIDDQPPPRSSKTYVNFKCAKWGIFTSKVEERIARLPQPSSCSQGGEAVS